MAGLNGSYVTVEEAEEYIDQYYFDASALSAWNSMSQKQKEQALRSSTHAIDTAFRGKLRGQKKLREQPFEFPRWDRNKIGMVGGYPALYNEPVQAYDATFVDGSSDYSNDGLIEAKHATIINAVYMAGYNHLESTIIQNAALSLRAMSIGSVHEQYGSSSENKDSTAIKQGIYALDKVRAELRDWLSGSYMTFN